MQHRNAGFLLLGFGILVLTLLGCGGGGGGTAGDTTPPQVASVSPADGSTDVATGSVLTITFNESMEAATIDDVSIYLNNSVTATVAYDATLHRATLIPSNPLTDATTYIATVTTDCTDSAGNAMAADYTWQFTTGTTAVGDWVRVGGQVSPSANESEDPTMMIVNGTPAVGYRQASFQVHLNAWDGSSWGLSAVDPSNNNMNYTGYHAPSFCTAGNTVYMTYSLAGVSGSTTDAFYDRVFVHSWSEAGGWADMNSGEEVSLKTTSPPGANAFEPAIACSGSGDPIVAWLEDNTSDGVDEDHVLMAEVSGTNADRSAFLNRNTSTGSYATSAQTVGIVTDGSDSYIAQWEDHQTNQDRTDLYVTRYSGGGFTNLGAAIAADYTMGNYLSKPSLAVAGGNLYVAYTSDDNAGATRHVYVQVYDTVGGTWSLVGGGPVSAYDSADHYDSGNPDLLAVNGELYIAWEESDQYDGPFIYVARYDTAGSQWEIVGSKLNVDNGNAAQDPSLAYDATGDELYVAFEENTDGHPNIFVKKKFLNTP